MSLETEDIVIIVAAVVITLLLVLCCVNVCYFFWLKKDNRFASKNAFPKNIEVIRVNHKSN